MHRLEREIRLAICDDDEHDRTSLHTLCAAYLDENDLVAPIDEFSSGEAFLAANPDDYALVFLDIYMNGMNGMETAKRLVAEHPSTKLVFCSSSADFAVDSYDVNALHYLIKPAERSRLFRVLDRFFSDYREGRTLTVKVARQTETVLLSDVLYIEADNKRSIIHTKHGDIIASEPLSALCQKLTPPEFVKPIRYALVSMHEVVAVPTDVLTLSNGVTVPISRSERKNVKQAFTEYKWLLSSTRR